MVILCFVYLATMKTLEKESQARVCLFPVETTSDLRGMSSLSSNLQLPSHLRTGVRARS